MYKTKNNQCYRFTIPEKWNVCLQASWVISSLLLIKDLRASNPALGKFFLIKLLVSLYDENVESSNISHIKIRNP